MLCIDLPPDNRQKVAEMIRQLIEYKLNEIKNELIKKVTNFVQKSVRVFPVELITEKKI